MTPAARLKKTWDFLSKFPGGKAVFNFVLGQFVPYTGTIRPKVIELRPGYCKIQMKDGRRVRNHLNSIHAVALVNLGEVTSGLAFSMGIPANARSIVTGLEVEYHKKARGTLTAISESQPPTTNQEQVFQVVGKIFDSNDVNVATVKVNWKISPAKS